MFFGRPTAENGVQEQAFAADADDRPYADAKSSLCAAAAQRVSSVFGEVVTLLMRTPRYQDLALTDLEWLVVPAVVSGQVSVAIAQSDVGAFPVGTILWASVSAEVAERLAAEPRNGARLEPGEWTSGEIVWIAASAGDGGVLNDMLQRLSDNEWLGKEVRMVVETGGRPIVATLARAA